MLRLLLLFVSLFELLIIAIACPFLVLSCATAVLQGHGVEGETIDLTAIIPQPQLPCMIAVHLAMSWTPASRKHYIALRFALGPTSGRT